VTDAGRNYIVISGDSHAGAHHLGDFTPYVDPAVREDFVRLVEETPEIARPMGGKRGGFWPEVELDDPDPVRRAALNIMVGYGVPEDEAREGTAAYSVDTVECGGNFDKRLRLSEAQGVAAEVYNPSPSFQGTNPPLQGLPAEMPGSGNEFLRAMKTANNRWLADMCNAAPGRRGGLIHVEFDDMERAIAEIRTCRESGLMGGVLIPTLGWGTAVPSYADPEYWEPLWSLLVDLKLPAYIHAGGFPADGATAFGTDPVTAWELGLTEVFYHGRRPFWIMMYGGVFDRHPDLKFVIGENQVGWVPGMLQELECHFDMFWRRPGREKLQLRPTEYFQRHIFLAGSIMNRQEVEQRHDIGIDNLGWGSDMPHPEGTNPYSREVMQHQFHGVPEADTRKILGLNALEVWDFDRDVLQGVADRIGPSPADLASPLAKIPACFSSCFVPPVSVAGRAVAAMAAAGV
jgi:predicted TIM-barrel fold metal-dependent hydrolase